MQKEETKYPGMSNQYLSNKEKKIFVINILPSLLISFLFLGPFRLGTQKKKGSQLSLLFLQASTDKSLQFLEQIFQIKLDTIVFNKDSSSVFN